MTDAVDDVNLPPFYQSTDPETAAVRDGLREVIDPELGMNVVELGLIRNFEKDEDFSTVTMILTTPFCPYGPAMMESVKKKTAEVVGGTVQIEMGLEMWDPSMMEDGAGGDWGLF